MSRRVEEKLGHGAVGVEDRVAGDGAVADEVAVEVGAHGLGERGEVGRRLRPAGAVEDGGVAVHLLEEQRDGPARHHGVAKAGVGGLQRVVPVALAVADEMGAGDEARADGGEERVDVRGDRIAAGGDGQVVGAPRHRLVEEGAVVGRLDVVAERLERPDDDVAVAVAVADLGVGRQHEPLRPVAAGLALLGEDGAQDVLDRRVVLEGEEELDRTLADVAGAPGRAARLLEAVGDGEMDHAVLGEPRQQGVELGDALAVAGQADGAGDVAPVGRGRGEALGLVDAAGVLRGERLGGGGVGEDADDGQVEGGGRAGAERR